MDRIQLNKQPLFLVMLINVCDSGTRDVRRDMFKKQKKKNVCVLIVRIFHHAISSSKILDTKIVHIFVVRSNMRTNK
jgi:hypothetical protein